MRRHLQSTLLVTGLLAAPAAAQQRINLDIGTLAGAPSVSFPGEAGQTGFWHSIPATASALPVRNTDGFVVPGLTITISGGSEFTFDEPLTSGDEEALVDDLSRATGSQTITLSNSQTGSVSAEQLIVYAWAPDDATALSTVRVVAPFTSLGQDIGGAWSPLAGGRWGTLYAWTPADGCDFGYVGDLVIQIDPAPGSTTTSVNGLQLFTDFVCFGAFCSAWDGALAACPCQNRGRPTAGCDTPQGNGGVELRFVEQSFGPPNRATFHGSGFPVMGTPGVVVMRGPSVQTPPFALGDGLLCLPAQSVVRLGGALASGGTSTHVIGHGFGAGSGVFFYQLWFRSLPATFCDAGAGFNTSNGTALIWF